MTAPSGMLLQGVNVDVWWILGRCITLAEHLLGPRDPSFTPLGVHLSDFDQPCLSFPPSGTKQVLVNLGRGAGPLNAQYQIAHEAVHLLNPVQGMASVLEEGLAVWIVGAYCAQDLPGYDPGPLPPAYADALALVQPLLGDLTPLREWRAAHPGRGLTDLTTAELRGLYPDLRAEDATALTARHVNRP
ncbi:hypothetical protein [Deinococcus yunweiensis]|uniref:hypothetical protein n=1 Tax=Deinococcus yunweiensis TaxID=367282 RepID=UPI00398E4107